tara:strand:+ start:53904 stop:54473 length:570 start_codon:yes stop_codon:yes gene_type:complete
MTHIELQNLKLDLAVRTKKGIDFILAATIVWFIIAFIWSKEIDSYHKSVLTFMVGALLLPLAFILSKLLKTDWKIVNNPLQPLGLWLNFAQLFYFPFLVFVLLNLPEYFVMTYAIITGAHLFPYSWLYDDTIYAIMAGVISASSLIIGLNISLNNMFYIPLFIGFSLLIMFILLWLSIPKTNQKSNNIY